MMAIRNLMNNSVFASIYDGILGKYAASLMNTAYGCTGYIAKKDAEPCDWSILDAIRR